MHNGQLLNAGKDVKKLNSKAFPNTRLVKPSCVAEFLLCAAEVMFNHRALCVMLLPLTELLKGLIMLKMTILLILLFNHRELRIMLLPSDALTGS